jgi:hypothetical protein
MTIGEKLMTCVAGMLAVVLGLAAGWYSNKNLGNELKFATASSLIGRKQIATVSMADLYQEPGISDAFRISGGRGGSAVEGPAVAD